MAQKINPISFRLGIIKVWKSFLQTYGKSFNSYFKILHKHYQLQKILNRLFQKNNLVLDYQEWKIYKDKILLNIYYLRFPWIRKLSNNTIFSKSIMIISQLFKLKVYAYFYLKLESKFTTNLVIIYVQYLLNQNNTPKKVLINVCKLLENHLESKKVLFLKSGLLKTNLKGFKVKLAGRLDGSKNQMAKSIEQSIGSIPLASVKNYVEYKNKEIYTRYGVCGLQIWLFYEII